MKNPIILLALILMLQACSQEEMVLPGMPDADFSITNPLEAESLSPVDAIFRKPGEEELDDGLLPHSQYVNFQNHEGATIETQEGLVLNIPPYAFVDAQSLLPVDEEIQLEVIEIYQKAGMIYQNKPTNFQHTFLISGGEFFLGATYEGHELTLGRGIEIDVELPVKVNNGAYAQKMKLFTGDYETGKDGEPTDRFSWNSPSTDHVQLRNTFPAVYIFSISQLGWTNCDAFLDDPRRKVSTLVELDGKLPPQDCMVFIVPKHVNGVMRIYRDMRGQFKTMPSIPEGLEATLVAIAHSGGQSFIGTQEVKITENETLRLRLTPASSQEIKDQLALLNQ